MLANKDGFQLHTCIKILFCDWLVYMVNYWYTREFIRSYHTYNYDTIIFDVVQLFPSEWSNLGDSSNHKFKNININRTYQSIFQEGQPYVLYACV